SPHFYRRRNSYDVPLPSQIKDGQRGARFFPPLSQCVRTRWEARQIHLNRWWRGIPQGNGRTLHRTRHKARRDGALHSRAEWSRREGQRHHLRTNSIDPRGNRSPQGTLGGTRMHCRLSQKRSPTRSLEAKTPYEALHGHKPNLSHLIAIGTKAFVPMAMRCERLGLCPCRASYGVFASNERVGLRF